MAWSPEAERLAKVLRRPPVEALSRALQALADYEPEELEERPLGHWEAMLTGVLS